MSRACAIALQPGQQRETLSQRKTKRMRVRTLTNVTGEILKVRSEEGDP